MAETLTGRPACGNAFLNAVALHLLKPSRVGWSEGVEHRSCRRQAVVDGHLLPTSGIGDRESD